MVTKTRENFDCVLSRERSCGNGSRYDLIMATTGLNSPRQSCRGRDSVGIFCVALSVVFFRLLLEIERKNQCKLLHCLEMIDKDGLWMQVHHMAELRGGMDLLGIGARLALRDRFA